MTEETCSSPTTHMTPHAWANQVIVLFLKEIDQALRQDALTKDQRWDRLFGAKDSLVVNIERLVSTMAELRKMEMAAPHALTDEPKAAIGPEEMKLVSDWLAEMQQR